MPPPPRWPQTGQVDLTKGQNILYKGRNSTSFGVVTHQVRSIDVGAVKSVKFKEEGGKCERRRRSL